MPMGYVKANLPDEIHRALKIEAAVSDKNVEVIARDVIITHFEEHVSPESVAQAHRGGGVDG